MKRGDPIRLTCQGRTVDATVLIASEDDRSLAVYFDGILDGHVGAMPIVRREGGYEALLTRTPVTIEKRQ